jgi:hypothetical protein
LFQLIRELKTAMKLDEPVRQACSAVRTTKGAMFQIFPVDMNIQQFGDDHAYSFDWVEGKQYWFDIVHDHARDKHDLCREIRMVDYGGRVDTMVVPGQTDIGQVGELWKRIIDVPANDPCLSRAWSRTSGLGEPQHARILLGIREQRVATDPMHTEVKEQSGEGQHLRRVRYL